MVLYFGSALLPLEVDEVQGPQVLRHFLILEVEVAVLLLELLVGERYFVVWVVLDADRTLFYLEGFFVLFGVGRRRGFAGCLEFVMFSMTFSFVLYLLGKLDQPVG